MCVDYGRLIPGLFECHLKEASHDEGASEGTRQLVCRGRSQLNHPDKWGKTASQKKQVARPCRKANLILHRVQGRLVISPRVMSQSVPNCCVRDLEYTGSV